MQSPAAMGDGQQQQQQWTMMQTPQPGSQPQNHEEVKTLWVGDLQYWVEESYLHNCFAHTGEVQSVKIIRNKQTGYSEGYGFVEFISHASAEKVLQAYNGTLMPNTEQPFRLNWASFGIGERRPEAGPEHSIFVGDLAPDVTDYMLQETFRTRYPSVKGAKVVTDANTGRSKGYGFVRFGEEMERNRAMSEMNGVYCSTRPMRISAATPKKALGPAQQQNPNAIASSYHTAAAYGGAITPPHAVLNDNDPNNTTIFVGGLDPTVGDEDLKAVFAQFGELVYVKIPLGKGCGFVQFTHRSSAEEALQRVHGTVIGSQAVRLSWGRSPTNKQTSQDPSAGWGQQDPNQWGGGGGYYGGYGQGYDQYGYPIQASQDAGAYGYGAYAGYGNYSQQAAVMTAPAVEHKEDEIFDPLAPPDIEK
jgi:RNA recognition motif-containing protein